MQSKATPGQFGKPIQEGVPGLQRDPKAKPPRLTYSIFRNDCHLPAMDSADRRLRPVRDTGYMHIHKSRGFTQARQNHNRHRIHTQQTQNTNTKSQYTRTHSDSKRLMQIGTRRARLKSAGEYQDSRRISRAMIRSPPQGVCVKESVCVWRLGLRASLQPWHSFLHRFAKVASVSWVLPCAAFEYRAWVWS